MVNFELNFVEGHFTVEKALNILNYISDNTPKTPLTLLVVNSDKKLLGTLTDGDIRRTLVSGTKLDERLDSCMNKNFTFLKKKDRKYHNVTAYKNKGIQILPLLNDDNTISKIYNLNELKSILPVETVFMAGGEGTRLRPLTSDMPKPLLKVGEKPIMERNMDRLITYGIDDFFVSIRYLGDQIVSYFGNGNKKGVNIRYIREEEPLGTAGGLSLIDSFQTDAILVSNSDILTTLNYEKFYLDFINRDADISVVTIPYRVKIPFGVFEVVNEKVSELKEKPEYTYYLNAGIYLIKSTLVEKMPKKQPLDFTDFIQQQITAGLNIVTFPFWGYWLDIGQLEDYENAQKAIQILDSF